MSKKQKQLTPVVLDWSDAYCAHDDEDDSVLQGKLKPRIMRTCCWLVKESKNHVVVAWEYDEGGDSDWRGYQVIPRQMVKRLVKLEPQTLAEYPTED